MIAEFALFLKEMAPVPLITGSLKVNVITRSVTLMVDWCAGDVDCKVGGCESTIRNQVWKSFTAIEFVFPASLKTPAGISKITSVLSGNAVGRLITAVRGDPALVRIVTSDDVTFID